MNVHFYLRFCDIILGSECPLPVGSGYDIVVLSESAPQYLYTPQYRGNRDICHRISTRHRIRDTPQNQGQGTESAHSTEPGESETHHTVSKRPQNQVHATESGTHATESGSRHRIRNTHYRIRFTPQNQEHTPQNQEHTPQNQVHATE